MEGCETQIQLFQTEQDKGSPETPYTLVISRVATPPLYTCHVFAFQLTALCIYLAWSLPLQDEHLKGSDMASSCPVSP